MAEYSPFAEPIYQLIGRKVMERQLKERQAQVEQDTACRMAIRELGQALDEWLPVEDQIALGVGISTHRFLNGVEAYAYFSYRQKIYELHYHPYARSWTLRQGAGIAQVILGNLIPFSNPHSATLREQLADYLAKDAEPMPLPELRA